MSITTVVVDEGSTQVKISWFDQDGIKSMTLQAMVTGEYVKAMNGKPNASSYTVAGNEYAVNENARKVFDNKGEVYQTSHHNRVLVHEALRQAGFGGQDVDVICTLPIRQYYIGSTNKVDEKRVQKKKDNIMGEISPADPEVKLANIVRCSVSPEAIPAWFTILLDDKFDTIDEKWNMQNIMIVDIGGTTTDISLIDGEGNSIARDGEEVGVLDLFEELNAIVVKETPVKAIQRNSLDHVMRDRTYNDTDLSTYIIKASAGIRYKILNKMMVMVPDSESLDAVVFVGGGSAIFGKELSEAYGNTANTYLNTEEADLQVARGLVAYSRLLIKDAA